MMQKNYDLILSGKGKADGRKSMECVPKAEEVTQ
jgi:hypothetical protein